VPRLRKEIDEDQEFVESVLFNDAFLHYLLEEIYPPNVLEHRTSSADSFYRQASAVHAENLELALQYENALIKRWRRLKGPADEARRRLQVKAKVTREIVSGTVEILVRLNACGYLTPRWQQALYSAWLSLFEPPDEELFEPPIRIVA
jgi:hypothetical protein